MRRTNFSPQLAKLLIIRGLCRAVVPISVLWGIYDWLQVDRLYALIYAALTGNYVLVYLISWVAPALLNGPWRVRPWQTFVLLANAIALPIIYHGRLGEWPWFFIAWQVLMVAALYVATAILFYFNARLPMSGVFMTRRGGLLVPPPPRPTENPATPTA